MTAMSIKVHKANLGTDIQYALVAKAVQYGDEFGRRPAKPFMSDFVVPAGVNASKRVECPPGRYRVEALLPSGDILNEDVLVEEGKEATVELRTGGSPREWLSWQTLAGIVSSNSTLENAVSKTVEWVKRVAEDSDVEIPSFEDIKNSPALEAVANAVAEEVLRSDDARTSKLAKLVKDVVGAGKVTWKDVTEAVSVLSTQPESDVAVLQHAEDVNSPMTAELTWREVGIPSDVARFWKRVGRSSAPIVRAGRKLGKQQHSLVEDNNYYLWKLDGSITRGHFNRWAVVRHDFGIELARLPLPWTSTTGEGRAPGVEILVDRRATFRPVRTTVTVSDSELGGLLSYMTAGTVGSGEPVLRELVDSGILVRALREKRDNPLAACAAGYAAIAVGNEMTFSKWESWIVTLMDSFRLIPDGAVIYARRMLHTAKTEADIETAKDAFKKAFRRGIPFYAAGVQHLQDGLFTFSRSDPEADRMYRLLQKVTPRLDPGQPFTVLRYPRITSK